MVDNYEVGEPVGTGILDAMTWKTKLDRTARSILSNIREPVRDKRDPAIIIVGGYANRGKTINTAIMCKFLQADFNPEKQIGRGMNQFLDAYEYTKNLDSKSWVKCCVFDESDDLHQGGDFRKRHEVYKLFNTMKQFKIIIFIVGNSWWSIKQQVFNSGSLQGSFIIRSWDDKRAYYAFLDASQTINVRKKCLDAEKNNGNQLYYAYVWPINQSLKGFIKKLQPKEVKFYDKISDKGKEQLQNDSIEKLRLMN